MDGLARCKRCGVMWEQSEPARCHYHPGTFANHNGNFIRVWSCCRESNERAKGCTSGDAHVLCEVTAASLEAFPQGLRRRCVAAAAREEEPEEPRPKKKPAPPGAVTYACVVGDTLSSVALKHNMPLAQLKKWNRLLAPNLFPGQQLFVTAPPAPTPAAVRAEALRRVMRRAACTQPEAAYYLDEFGGGTDADAALAGFAADTSGVGSPPHDEAQQDQDAWVVVEGRRVETERSFGAGEAEEQEVEIQIGVEVVSTVSCSAPHVFT